MTLAPIMFPLAPSWSKDRMWLVRANDAGRLCATGAFRALPRHETEPCLTSAAARDVSALREFIHRARLASFPVAGVADARLTDLVGRLVARADLVVVRECAQAAQSSGSAKQRRLLRDLQAKLRQPLSHEGRQYKLVADVDLRRMAGRDLYEVASRNEAAHVLQAVSKASDAALAVLLEQARGLLSADWKPPFGPDGLILLRKAVAVVAPVRMEDALTPSQMAKLREPKVSFTPGLQVQEPVRLSAIAKVEPPLAFEVGAQAEPEPALDAAAG